MLNKFFAYSRKNKFFYITGLLVLIIVALRYISLYTSPLFDTTEARYASIAQKIVIDDDWVTLRLPAGNEPFLGKPPLSFWLVAISYKLFGFNEVAARLPNFLASLLTALFTFLLARKFYDLRTAFLSVLIFLSSIFTFIQAGTVSLDMMVCCILTGSVWAYLSVLSAKEKNQASKSLLFEVVLGLFFGFGMLNKGPLSIVLFGGFVFLNTLWQRDWKKLFAVNWFICLAVGFVVAAPWYFLVQKANPDFLRYFFLQENFSRYLHRDYGDRYGNAHHAPYGASWVYTLGAFMPWSFVILPVSYYLWTKKRLSPTLKIVISWILISPLFFTFARSILMTYILGSLPPLAILCGRVLSKSIYKLRAGETLTGNNPILNFLFSPFSNLIYIVISVVVIAAGAVSYSGGYPYSMTRPMIMTSTIIVTLIGVGIGYIASKRTVKSFHRLVFLSALGVPVVMSYWYGPWSHSVSETKSMKAVISQLKNKVPDYIDKKITFVGEIPPYSWYFYTIADQYKIKTLFNHNFSIPTNNGKSKYNNLFVVTKANLNIFKFKYPVLYTNSLVANEGKYFIFGEDQA